MYTAGESSSGDKNLVPEPVLIYYPDSRFFDSVDIMEMRTNGYTSHVPLPIPHPSMTEAGSAEDKVKNNETEVVTLTGVVNDNDSNKVGNVGGVSSPATQSADPVMPNDCEGSSIKRGRGRPKKFTLIKDSVVSASSQSQSGHLPVVNDGFLVTRRRVMPPRSCKKTKRAVETDLHCPSSDDISGSGNEQEAGTTIPFTHSPDISGSAGSGFLLHTIIVRTKEGCFNILSLSGSFLPSKSGVQHNSTGGLSVLLAGPDDRLLGGSVSGIFTASSSIQIIVGTFLAPRSACNIRL